MHSCGAPDAAIDDDDDGTCRLECRWEGFPDTTMEPLDVLYDDTQVMVNKYLKTLKSGKERKRVLDSLARK